MLTVLQDLSSSKVKLDEHVGHQVTVTRDSVSWSAGLPTVKLAASAFRGQTQSVEFGKAYAFTETLAPGQVYNYHFDTREIKKPLQEAVTSCGWTYKGVAFGKL
jgi:hypothetical protein